MKLGFSFFVPRAKTRGAFNLNDRRGSVLLEVVLALALFVGAATIISSGINASIRSVERVRLENHAVNLAVTILSQMQMHVLPVAPVGPEPFLSPFQDWTYKIEISQEDSAPEAAITARPVEVIIRNTRENVVQRMTQFFNATDISTTDTNSTSEPLLTGTR